MQAGTDVRQKAEDASHEYLPVRVIGRIRNASEPLLTR